MSNKMWCVDDDDNDIPSGLPYADADLQYLEDLNTYEDNQERGIDTPEPTLNYPTEPVYGATGADDETTQIVDPENVPVDDETEKSQDESEIVF